MAEDDARTRIAEAALERFGRQGIRETSTREILRDAGMKNPSAITYHFGSKAKLVEYLVGELVRTEAPVVQRQIELAAGPQPPSVEEWAAVAVDSSNRLVSTERGLLLTRMWSDYHNALKPDVFEEFLAGGSTLATEWSTAVATTFPDLGARVALARNLIMFRTLEWIITRRANRLLRTETLPTMRMEDTDAFRRLMLEVSVGILAAPTTLSDSDIQFDV